MKNLAWGFLGECGFFLLLLGKHCVHQTGLCRGGHVSPSDSQGQGWGSSLRFPGRASGHYPYPLPQCPVLGGLLWRAAHQALIPTSLLCLLPTLQCPSKTFGTFTSTKDFPDDVIQFARNHPLMYNSVLPMGGRPLFLQVGAGYTFTQIAADRVAAADGHYDVLFIGTGQGPGMATHRSRPGPLACEWKLPQFSPISVSLLGCVPISFWMLH